MKSSIRQQTYYLSRFNYIHKKQKNNLKTPVIYILYWYLPNGKHYKGNFDFVLHKKEDGMFWVTTNWNWNGSSNSLGYLHYVKSVRIPSYPGPYFPKCGKIRTKITPNKDAFYVVLYRKILDTIARSVSKYISIITGQKSTFSLRTFVVNVNKRLREDFIFCAVSLSSPK